MAIRAHVFSPAMMVLVVLTVMPGAPTPAAPAVSDHAPATVAQAHMASAPLAPEEEAATQARLEQAFGHLPLYFVENQGQMDERVAYYIQGSDKMIYFTPEGVTFALTASLTQTAATAGAHTAALRPVAFRSGRETPPERQRWVVKLDFVGANPDVRPVGEEQQEAVISYFEGQPDEWRTGLPTYSRLVYRDLWPGIDLAYYGTVDRLKYEFIVHPGADPGQIRLAYRGATGVAVNAAGQLEVETPIGGFADDSPVAYQEIDGQRVDVPVEYALHPFDPLPVYSRAESDDSTLYTFQIGPYDRSHPLVLDPVVLVYCGYIGGSGPDEGSGIAVDGAGNVYVVGATWSSEAWGFPVTVGPDLTYNGDYDKDAFVAKVQADGTALAYCGYIGGSDYDWGEGIAVDGAGNAYVVGYTTSTEAEGFPVTVGPDLTYNGDEYDAFVAKVNAAGTALVYAGYIGGSAWDYSYGIAVDGAGNAYVVGYTESSEAGGFPVTVGPDLTYNGGQCDAFVAKVNAAGTGLVYAGYIGGSDLDYGYGIGVDGAGNAYVVGDTFSSAAEGFPVTVGPDLTFNGYDDVYVAKVSAAGTALVYAGYIGGSGWEYGSGIAVDGAGNAYVVGYTWSSAAGGFPVTVGPDLTYSGGEYDAFVAKVNAAGTALTYCGYIGGLGEDVGNGIAVDGAGNAYVVGSTGSSEAQGFPVTVGPDLTYNGDEYDAFVAKVNAAGTGLVHAGYIGGSDLDKGSGIAVDGAGNAYVVGRIWSSEAQGFPVTVGPDLTYNGGNDAFVAKVATICFISGRVTDAGSNPITDVLVLADAGLNTTTNAGGYYTLTTILTGAYILTPTLNGASFWPVTRTVTITSADVSGQDFTGVITPTGVIITGPLTGTVGLFYTFTAATRPVTTTMPITYTWAPEPVVGQGMAVAAYWWTLPGTQTLTVTVTNAGGAVMATHAIELKSLVFLPLVLRKQ